MQLTAGTTRETFNFLPRFSATLGERSVLPVDLISGIGKYPRRRRRQCAAYADTHPKIFVTLSPGLFCAPISFRYLYYIRFLFTVLASGGLTFSPRLFPRNTVQVSAVSCAGAIACPLAVTAMPAWRLPFVPLLECTPSFFALGAPHFSPFTVPKPCIRNRSRMIDHCRLNPSRFDWTAIEHLPPNPEGFRRTELKNVGVCMVGVWYIYIHIHTRL